MEFYQVDDVMKMLGISQSKAYGIIRDLNKELKAKGYIIINGKVPKIYFEERLYCSGSSKNSQKLKAAR
ncbi:transcriptional regulator [Desulfitobacterium chlororespirans]|uniref:ICEBs1 excisionase n=1 Tax=Desulfitobacterium chlororespirans DSM 11544 TaxID=1121395 RepID=A0A1M7T683_9FIRM|nr:transcriptional regulator [Desulfitobacterium chlororespirans]SHN66195.1 hypothetical protein SAMN02745215_01631 [Desulfitobacterium chlororespirans DSM 11544]